MVRPSSGRNVTGKHTLPPLVPAMTTSDTLPRRRKSNMVTPTTPICSSAHTSNLGDQSHEYLDWM
jgi:hypothetical protein